MVRRAACRALGVVLVVGAAVYSIDRFEPPMAVLITPDGQTLDVPLATLPAAARPGDRLASPTGPIVGDRAARAAALRARLQRLTGDDAHTTGHPGPSDAGR